MNRYQPLQCLIAAINRRLSHLLLANRLCFRVSTLLSDAQIVAPSGKQFRSFQRKVSSRALNATMNALLSCLAPGSHQEICLSIKFTSLNQRKGIRRLMVNLIVPESLQQRSDPCVLARCSAGQPRFHPVCATQTRNLLNDARGEYQCQTSSYLYIECTSRRLSLPACWVIRAARVRLTHIVCPIPARIAFRARP